MKKIEELKHKLDLLDSGNFVDDIGHPLVNNVVYQELKMLVIKQIELAEKLKSDIEDANFLKISASVNQFLFATERLLDSTFRMVDGKIVGIDLGQSKDYTIARNGWSGDVISVENKHE